MYYPEVSQELAGYLPGRPNLLILAGSTLHRDFEDVPSRLRGQLERRIGGPVGAVNLATPSHASLDSYYKYRLLGERRFDAVIVYHSINELRANNVPPALWRDDYAHYAWYDEINFYFRRPALAAQPFVAPFYLKHLAVTLDRKILRPKAYVPPHDPRPDWVRYGARVKSAAPFRENLSRIVGLARERGALPVLMTFAHAPVEGYTRERFQAKTLGYAQGKQEKEIELWGSPGHIIEGLRVHNQVIEGLAREREVLLVDQHALMGSDLRYFVDICHFSPEGAEVFAAHLADALSAEIFVGQHGGFAQQ